MNHESSHMRWILNAKNWIGCAERTVLVWITVFTAGLLLLGCVCVFGLVLMIIGSVCFCVSGEKKGGKHVFFYRSFSCDSQFLRNCFVRECFSLDFTIFRYVILGCSHDSWTYGAADPGNSLAMSTEILRVFSSAVAAGWKPRRSILFISWDANLHAASGVSRWLQVNSLFDIDLSCIFTLHLLSLRNTYYIDMLSLFRPHFSFK